MNKKLAIAACAALTMGVGAAQATPLILPSGSPIYFQYNNLEQLDASGTNSISASALGISSIPGYSSGATFGNWGIFNVSSIQLGGVTVPHQDISGGTNFFSNLGIGHGQVYGIFYGIDVASSNKATGGVLRMYWTDNGFINNACMSGSTCGPNAATVAKFTSGTFLGQLDFASGIDSTSNTTTVVSNSPVIGSNLSPGTSSAFANVDMAAGGLWASALNNPWFQPVVNGSPVGRDVRLTTNYNLNSAWNGATPHVVGLRSNDPLRVFTVPEPGSVALIGIGMLGMGLRMGSRRKS